MAAIYDPLRYETSGGVHIERTTTQLGFPDAVQPLIDALDSRRGVLLVSNVEFPGRYTLWDIGFVDPPVGLTAYGRLVEIEALNERGTILLLAISGWLSKLGPELIDSLDVSADRIVLTVTTPQGPQGSFAEEQRSRQPSVFSIIRTIIGGFFSPEESHLGLFGPFGYDLAFQFDPIELHHERPSDQRDLVLYIPDRIVVVDHRRELALQHDYEFTVGHRTTLGAARGGSTAPYQAKAVDMPAGDHEPGEYEAGVEKAREYFLRGDLFEVVPSQVLFEPAPPPPSELFRRLCQRNPAPYSALMNLGEAEYLVTASPEMYVRVTGKRVETRPIAGTIERGSDVFSDAENIAQLLSSGKEESELTMCTDVDRNDKSRICEPGSIKVIGRRQIEMYSRVIHTVDHVEGTLLPQFDALDAFLAHTWAVTVTGAPKLWAMRFIEMHEHSPRRWYGGALGYLTFDGNANTGLTLRTIRVKDGVAEIRVGATLLIDSDPSSEERETRNKAAAMLDAIRRPLENGSDDSEAPVDRLLGAGLHILLADHEDSFVHTLGGYLRRTGAKVTTVRVPVGSHLLAEQIPRDIDIVVISPGPGLPSDFHVDKTLSLILGQNLAVFGVCLGLQALVEYFGGDLDTLDYPIHGRGSTVVVKSGALFAGLPHRFTAGRYHSLYARRETLPECLKVTAETDDGIVMAIEHNDLPIAAVQFHPESIMTMKDEIGFGLISNVIRSLVLQRKLVPGGARSDSWVTSLAARSGT